jgi:hypothetical protein
MNAKDTLDSRLDRIAADKRPVLAVDLDNALYV